MSGAILITGVGKRMGLALAKDFLSKGFELIGTYRRTYPELDELREAGATLYQCDFYQQADLDCLIRSLNEQGRPLRALIHNASDWLPDNADMPPAEVIEKMMQVHVSVPYQLNLALESQLRPIENEPRDIIHISDYVVEKGSKKHIAYAASKAALENMTLSFATRLAPTIKVNAIAPALLRFNEHDSDEYKAKALTKALIPKEGGFDEVISSVGYLMNSAYVTGRILHLDGGRHLK